MAAAPVNRGDVVSGAVLAGLGAFIIVESRKWEYSGIDGPGPGFFPLWYGIAMVALSLLLMGASFLRSSSGEKRKPVDWSAVGNAALTWFAFTVCVGLLKTLGFLLSFALLTFFIVAVMYRRPLKTATYTAAGCVLGFYLVFPLGLKVSLPVGVLGF
jgi:putative tricarboxylic transport membrane protein